MDLRDQLQITLGNAFTIDRELGGGGMSRVYVARDEALGREVVVKILPPELAAELSVERFTREVRLAAALQHPHIVPVLSAGDARGLPYYTMPLVRGESLRARLARDGALPFRDAVAILRDVAKALAYAHAQGIVHRDIKPDNILLTGGSAVVLDFGIAKAITASRTQSTGATLTQLGTAIGTPAYMAPEQAAGDPNVGPAADLYALGVTAFEMLAGVPVFPGKTPQELVRAHIADAPPSLAAKRTDLPPALVALVDRCLRKTPEERPADATAVLQALDDVATPAPNTLAAFPSAATTAPAMPAGRRRRFVTIIGLLVALSAVGYWAVYGRQAAALDTGRVLVLGAGSTGGDPSLAAVANLLPDVIVRGLTPMRSVTIAGAPVDARAPGGEREVRTVASANAAGTVVSVTLLRSGDSVQMQFRVFDGRTGSVIRSLTPVSVARAASPEALQASTERLLTTVGFVADPKFGAVTLPAGDPPSLASFRELGAALDLVTRPDTVSVNRRAAHLARAVELDTGFVQARLWRAFIHEWNGDPSRSPAMAAMVDSVNRSMAVAAQRLTLFEAAFADCVKSFSGGISDRSLETFERLTSLSPGFPMVQVLPALLLELNRPRAAVARYEKRLAQLSRADTSGKRASTGAIAGIAEAQHYLGEHAVELRTWRRARAIAPNDMLLLRGELRAMAALGDIAGVRRGVDEVSAASSNDRLFGFAGDVYLITAQELIVHGHPDVAAEVLKRTDTWFATRSGEDTLNSALLLRKTITLHLLGRDEAALAIARKLDVANPNDVRFKGYIGRILASRGDTAGTARVLAELAALPARQRIGAPTYERAAITANLGRAHWDEAVALLEESLQQGQGFNIRSRVHYFSDWVPLKDYPPFRKVITPRG